MANDQRVWLEIDVDDYLNRLRPSRYGPGAVYWQADLDRFARRILATASPNANALALVAYLCESREIEGRKVAGKRVVTILAGDPIESPDWEKPLRIDDREVAKLGDLNGSDLKRYAKFRRKREYARVERWAADQRIVERGAKRIGAKVALVDWVTNNA